MRHALCAMRKRDYSMPENQDKDQNPDRPQTPIIVKMTWAKAISRIGVAAVIIFGLVYLMVHLFDVPKELFKTTDQIVKNRMEEFSNIVTALNSGIVITELRSYTTKVTSSNYLQITQLQTVETFTKRDSLQYWPDVEVETRAPVEYTFYLDLQDEWHFTLVENPNDSGYVQIPEIIIRAPDIKWNKPSVDISKMTERILRGSILRDEEAVKRKLRAEISKICYERAAEKIDLIRAIARENTKQYIESWLINVMFRDYEVKPRIRSLQFGDEWRKVDKQDPDTLSKPLIEGQPQ